MFLLTTVMRCLCFGGFFFQSSIFNISLETEVNQCTDNLVFQWTVEKWIEDFHLAKDNPGTPTSVTVEMKLAQHLCQELQMLLGHTQR